MSTELLLQQLIENTRLALNQGALLKNLDQKALTWRASDTSWNILECLEHLNLYGDFYLPKIERSIQTSPSKPEATFTSGPLGAYFARIMLPKIRLNAMKTFTSKNPIHKPLTPDVIDRFIAQQITLLNLLNEARSVNLNTVRIPTTISTLIRIKLGDTFQFYINHMLRHLQQVERVQKAMKHAEKC